MTIKRVTNLEDDLRAFEGLRPIYVQFTRKLEELFRALLSARDIDIHLIDGRTKELSSLREKLRRGTRAGKTIAEISDLCGLRIIAYYSEDVSRIGQMISDEFRIDTSRSSDRRTVTRPEEFGYQSVHYVVQLADQRRTLPEWAYLADLTAEVQVRTVLQHAWAAISHKLQYKREADVPNPLRRRLFRLSALLELADDEFMAVRDSTSMLTQAIETQLSEGHTDLELNLLSVDEFVRTSVPVVQLARIAERVGFLFDDAESEEAQDGTSDLVELSSRLGLRMLTELQEVVEGAGPWAEDYLRAQRDASEVEWTVTPAFICELLLIGALRSKVKLAYLKEAGWSPEIAERVLRTARMSLPT